MKKGKSQIGINQANKPNKFICGIRTWTSYLPVGIFYCFKAEKKSKKFQRRNAAAANESTLRMWLNQPNQPNQPNSYLAFSFFHFSTTTLLKLGVCVNIFIMNQYISKSYTRSKNTIYRAGAAVVSTITSLRQQLIMSIFMFIHFDCFYDP